MNKCVIITEPGKVEMREAPEPEPKPGDALLRMLYGGICGSDINTYRGTQAYVSYPRVPGHELAAEIVEVAADGSLRPGDIVTVNPYFNCGVCYSCRRGMVNCCYGNQTMGVQREGGFAHYITVPVERLYKAEGIDAADVALIEPFCISYHGIRHASIQPGERVLVIGGGTIGILAMAAAKIAGAEVYVSDVAADKLSLAKSLGADGVILNDGKENLALHVAEVTEGSGFDVTVEAVGLPSTFQNCIDAAAFGGRVIVLGVGKQNLDFNFTMIQKKELLIHGSRNALKRDFEDVIEIIRGNKFNVRQIVTNVYPFEESARAFADFDKGAGSMLKVLLKFTD